MAKKVKSAKLKVQSENILPGGRLNNLLTDFQSRVTNFRTSKTFYLVIIALGLLLLIIYKKSWIIAAMVDGTPVTNLELQSKLNQQFRSKTLDQLITEKIILNEAIKNNAVPAATEIDGKIKEIETQIGGAQALDSLLSQQGQTRSSVRDSIKIQLAMTKLYDKDATVSAEEVTQFIEENKEQMRATDSASQQKEAYDALKNQKLTQIFSQKFQELRKKAKIQIF